MDNRPLSQIYAEAGADWVEKDAVARLLEETKSLRFAQRCQQLGDIPVNRAEQIVKADPSWYDEVTKMVHARTDANKARVYMETVKMRHSEHISTEANYRTEAKL